MTNITDEGLIATILEVDDLRPHVGHHTSCMPTDDGAELVCDTCGVVLAQTQAPWDGVLPADDAAAPAAPAWDEEVD